MEEYNQNQIDRTDPYYENLASSESLESKGSPEKTPQEILEVKKDIGETAMDVVEKESSEVEQYTNRTMKELKKLRKEIEVENKMAATDMQELNHATGVGEVMPADVPDIGTSDENYYGYDEAA